MSTVERVAAGIEKCYRRFIEGLLLYVCNRWVGGVLASSFRLWWYRKAMGFSIGRATSILPGLRVSGYGNIVIGDGSVINNGCCLDNRRGIRIGDNVSISLETMILTEGHDIDSDRFGVKGGDVVIEDYAWLCARVMVLPGVMIGRGAVALPGSVVAHDVPPMTVVGGAPAVFVRERRSSLGYRLNWAPTVAPLL